MYFRVAWKNEVGEMVVEKWATEDAALARVEELRAAGYTAFMAKVRGSAA